MCAMCMQTRSLALTYLQTATWSPSMSILEDDFLDVSLLALKVDTPHVFACNNKLLFIFSIMGAIWRALMERPSADFRQNRSVYNLFEKELHL